jgi:hypothetical protein
MQEALGIDLHLGAFGGEDAQQPEAARVRASGSPASSIGTSTSYPPVSSSRSTAARKASGLPPADG